jgi:hypothetical protein
MLHWLIVVMVATIAGETTAAGPNDSGGGEKRATYVLTFENGRVLPVFWDEKKDKGNKVYLVEVDTPWDPGNLKTVDSSEIEVTRESKRDRDKRKEDYLARNGLTEIKPDKYYVPTADVKWARLAREKAGIITPPGEVSASEEAVPEPAAPETSQESMPVAPAPPQPSFAAEWGAYIALGGIMILLIAVVTKTLLLAKTA